MKKTGIVVLTIFVTFLVICNMYLLLDGSKDVVKETESDSKPVVGNYQGTFLDVLQNDGLSLDGLQVQRLGDMSVCSMEDLFHDMGDSVLLICRTSYFHCEKCVDYAIEKALEMTRKDSCNVKLVVFGCYENANSLKLLQQSHPSLNQFDVYQTPSVLMPIDAHGYPYYFTMNKSMIVQDVFVPDSKEPVKTDIYWDCILTKWNEIQFL